MSLHHPFIQKCIRLTFTSLLVQASGMELELHCHTQGRYAASRPSYVTLVDPKLTEILDRCLDFLRRYRLRRFLRHAELRRVIHNVSDAWRIHRVGWTIHRPGCVRCPGMELLVHGKLLQAANIES